MGRLRTMRDIIVAFILGIAFATSLLAGAEAVDEGGGAWILQLIVIPLTAVTGIVSLLLGQRKKRAPAQSRRPNPQEPNQEPEPHR